MFRDRVHDALRAAERPTLERIREDRGRLPVQLRPLLACLETRLFDPDLTIGHLRRQARVGDTSASTQLKAFLGVTLRDYVAERRLETAARMLRDSTLGVGRVGEAVGYGSYSAFYRAYRKWCGEPPSASSESEEPPVDADLVRRALAGELSTEEALELIERLRRMYPDALPEGLPDLATTPEPAARVVVDGEGYERFRAEHEVWPALEGRPFEEQRHLVGRYAFATSALFDVLRERSRIEGRRDRQRGIELALLALGALDGSSERLGARVHDLRALGHAWVGNARRLALDFPGAERDFARAYEAWKLPRPSPDALILAQVQDLQGILRRCQRRYDEALDLADRAVRGLRAGAEPERLAQALLARATTWGSSGSPECAVLDLEEASDLLAEGPIYLRLAAAANIAYAWALIGEGEKAAEVLPAARTLAAESGDLLAFHQLRFTEGLIEKHRGRVAAAERCFQEAVSGFTTLHAMDHAGVVVLELATLFHRQGKSDRVLELAVTAVTIFEALRVHPEALTALRLLRNAIRTRHLSLAVLEELRVCIQQIREVR